MGFFPFSVVCVDMWALGTLFSETIIITVRPLMMALFCCRSEGRDHTLWYDEAQVSRV